MGVPDPTWVRAALSSAVSIAPPWNGCEVASVEDGDDPVGPVDADALPCGDPGRRQARAGHRRDSVLPAHDGGVAHDPADVGDGGPDAVEDGRPGRGRERRDEDLSLLDAVDLLGGEDHPGRAL